MRKARPTMLCQLERTSQKRRPTSPKMRNRLICGCGRRRRLSVSHFLLFYV